MKRLFALVVIALLAAACQPVRTAQPTTPSAPSPATAASALTSADGLSAAPLGEGVLATDWQGDTGWLVVLDPASGQRLAAAEPIRLGANYFSAYAPDGRTLAILSLDGLQTSLHLIDLATWTETTASLDVPHQQYLVGLRFSPNGKKLVFATPSPTNSLYVVDVISLTISAQTQLEFAVRALAFTQDDTGVMAYGVPLKPYSEVTAGDPRAVLLAAVDLSERWRGTFPDLKDGVYPKDEQQTANLHAPGAAYQYTPGLAFAPDQDRLFIVSGNSDQFVTVDFAAQKISEATVAKSLNFIEHLLQLTAGVAHAKVMDGTNQQAAISADGKTLYTVGMTNIFSQMSNGEYNLDQTPLDLRAINTADGTLRARTPSTAESLSLASDGRALYGVAYHDSNYSLPFTQVLDPATLEVIQTLEGFEVRAGRRLNGENILLSINTGVGENSMTLAALDFNTYQVIGQWRPGHYLAWLTR